LDTNERACMHSKYISLQDQLVDEIAKEVQDETILRAFRSIPRHIFIQAFYTRSFPDGVQTWEKTTLNDPRWFEEVYTDRPLITSLDQWNNPNVSSSAPSIMAKMIQSLRLQPGMTVLEIGTGTGYNAALLATIVGNEHVTTIDVNESLLEQARARIEQCVGSGVCVRHADGRNLPDDMRTIDAILIAASHNKIEPSWIRALNQGGRLILNYSTHFSKAFLEAEKVQTGLVGQVASYEGDFMRLHDGQGVKWEPTTYTTLPVIEECAFIHQLTNDHDFRFFLQAHKQALTLHHYKKKSIYGVRDAIGRAVYFSSSQVMGDPSLWEEIKTLYELFEELARPSRIGRTFSMESEGTLAFVYH
jgi:protein-L-isoaspartate(D-aspartate) O-methyltransferase